MQLVIWCQKNLESQALPTGATDLRHCPQVVVLVQNRGRSRWLVGGACTWLTDSGSTADMYLELRIGHVEKLHGVCGA